MGFLLIMLATIFVLNLIFPSPGGSGYTGKPEKTWCPNHKWIYKDNYLVCEMCNKTPEQIIKEL